MPKVGDANYEYNFEEVEKHRVAGQRMQQNLWGAAMRLQHRDPGVGAQMVRLKMEQGYFLDYEDVLEHRGLAVNAGLYQVVPVEVAYPNEYRRLREEAEAKRNKTA